MAEAQFRDDTGHVGSERYSVQGDKLQLFGKWDAGEAQRFASELGFSGGTFNRGSKDSYITGIGRSGGGGGGGGGSSSSVSSGGTGVSVSGIGSSGGSSSSSSTSGGNAIPENLRNILTDEYGQRRDDKFGLTSQSGETGSGLIDLNKMFDEMAVDVAAIAKQQMSGAIPEDVQKQLRIMRAEKSLAGGLGAGSQAAKNVEARDLGLTSLDMVERGVQKAQSVAQLVEAKREFNKSYDLNVEKFMQDVRRTDLSALQLQESGRQFNERQRLMASELAAKVLTSYHEMSQTYISPDTAQSAYSSLRQDMSGLVRDLKSFY
jgi:hypothetical protein